jgi:hypothetical protein
VREPWEKLVWTSLRNTPNPTWAALDPPPSEAETKSANDARLDLNPTVPTFAILFPITDIAFPYELSPLTAEKSDVKIPMMYLLCSERMTVYKPVNHDLPAYLRRYAWA